MCEESVTCSQPFVLDQVCHARRPLSAVVVLGLGLMEEAIESFIDLIFDVLGMRDKFVGMVAEELLVFLRVSMVLTEVSCNCNEPDRRSDEDIHMFDVWLVHGAEGGVSSQITDMDEPRKVKHTCMFGTVWIEEAPLPITATFSSFHCSLAYFSGQLAV